jgi:spore maturation protein CgeB
LYGWWIEGEEDCAAQVPDEIQYFDWYFFLSRRSVDMMRERGHTRTSYQNHVINYDIFRPLPQIKSHDGKEYDACFVGKWSEKRQKFIEAALEVTPNIAVYGPKWRIKNLTNWAVLRCVKGNGIFGDQLVSLYGRTSVVMNISNWGGNSKQKRSGMNMRVLEVPACGAFLLTDTSIEMEDFLTPGVHVEAYETLDELKSKLAYYVEHAEEGRKIALNGMQHVREINIGYPQFVDKIVEIFQSGEMPHDHGVRASEVSL